MKSRRSLGRSMGASERFLETEAEPDRQATHHPAPLAGPSSRRLCSLALPKSLMVECRRPLLRIWQVPPRAPPLLTQIWQAQRSAAL
eukprot:2716250-Prymnesium_polylepis.1